MGAAPVTATKITPHRPTAFGFRRSTPESPANTDSTVPSWRTSTSGPGSMVDMLPPLLDTGPLGQVVLRLAPLNHLLPPVARTGRRHAAAPRKTALGMKQPTTQ